MFNNPTKVFVFGSLRKGHGNHPLLEAAGVEYLGTGRTVKEGCLTNWGGFPGCFFGDYVKEPLPIVGELYSVDNEQVRYSLDSLEGYPDFYTRSVVPVKVVVLGVTHDDEAWIYHNHHDQYRDNDVLPPTPLDGWGVIDSVYDWNSLTDSLPTYPHMYY